MPSTTSGAAGGRPARTAEVRYAVVIPTVGRPGLRSMAERLLAAGRTAPEEVIVVDDRPGGAPPLPVAGLPGVRVLRSGGRGPAAARDAGWRAARAEWIVFLDDDVRPGPRWTDRLAADLAGLPFYTAGSQARVRVPAPAGRRPTDSERGTLALAGAAWITADMAYRRSVLAEVGGFDTRFTRAYREDTDLALRVFNAGYQLVRGEREITHPPLQAGPWYSLGRQRGNADDALMRRLHGPRWRERVGEPAGRLPWHVLTTATLAAAGATSVLARRHPAARRAAPPLAAAWLALTADFARRRIVPGPRTPGEIAAMAATSVLIPPVACAHRLLGAARHRGARPHRRPAVRAILFDRDGTLVRDVPYNNDPARVRPTRTARAAVARARRAGVRVGVVSNQSGVARGLLTREELAAVNARIDALLGPFDTWQVCVHGPGDGCRCRKPGPGLVEAAAAELGVRPAECAVIGDIGADLAAARAAGARGILVPTPVTRPEEITGAEETARTVDAAVDLALAPRPEPGPPTAPPHRTPDPRRGATRLAPALLVLAERLRGRLRATARPAEREGRPAGPYDAAPALTLLTALALPALSLTTVVAVPPPLPAARARAARRVRPDPGRPGRFAGVRGPIRGFARPAGPRPRHRPSAPDRDSAGGAA
ncbi:HAD-IIIA family hydrolase [Marinactinospora rubrisoli]|uniref:D,D-heptose 1,7-bisphosphate phosphatase n=1 Tax=Marinactinospora rubrisoli TaxID=2715399 RepID=A0ABW2KPD2_9ACTN